MLCLHGDATSMSISFNLVGICRDVEEKWLSLKAVEKIGLFWREASCWHSTGVGQGWEYLDLKFKMAWPCLSRYCSNNSRALWRIAKNILHSIFKRKDFLGMKFHQRNSAIRFFGTQFTGFYKSSWEILQTSKSRCFAPCSSSSLSPGNSFCT